MDLDTLTFSGTYCHMLLRLLVCFVFNLVLVDRLYYPKSHRRDFYFTFVLVNIAIFLLVYFMIFGLEDMGSKAKIGVGIGLFGIFSIMRYRTETMPVREMTYLFLIVALSVVNAVAIDFPMVELVATNLLVLLMTWICEKRLKLQSSKLIQYDRVDLITDDRRDDLIDDLQKRTGLEVTKVEVGAVDFLKDTAVLRVYYNTQGKPATNTVDSKLRLRKEDLQNSF